MSSLKLRPQQTLDLKAQAKILITVAITANLLLALVLSLLLLARPEQSSAEVVVKRTSVDATARAHQLHRNKVQMALLPSPEHW